MVVGVKFSSRVSEAAKNCSFNFVHSLKRFQPHHTLASKVNTVISFIINMHCITICGTPLSFSHDSIYCGSVNWGIFDNYPLTHLLDLGHYSRWIAER